MRLRTKAREISLHLLYQLEINKQDVNAAFDAYIENNPQRREIVDFARHITQGTVQKADFIDSIIKKYVKNWEIERMAIIDRNILRLACFELLFVDDVPPKVSINEAIEMAKRFGDIDSPRFVNGILDKIYKSEGLKGKKPKDSNIDKDG